MKLWLNGKLTELHGLYSDPGAPPGDGLFETLILRKGEPRYGDAHLARLYAGAEALGIKLSYDAPFLRRAMAETAAANGLSDAVIRITLTRGAGERGLLGRPTLRIAAAPRPAPAEDARAIVAAGARRHEHAPLAQLAILNDPEGDMARGEAVEAGADEAILLNSHGRVAESADANVFLLIHGGLVTPPVSEGARPRVMRGETIRLTRAEEMPVTVDMLERASEVFLASDLGIRPVIRINDAPVGDGEAGLITQLLATRL